MKSIGSVISNLNGPVYPVRAYSVPKTARVYPCSLGRTCGLNSHQRSGFVPVPVSAPAHVGTKKIVQGRIALTY